MIFLTPANFVSLSSLGCALASLTSVVDNQPVQAAFWIVLSGLLDGMDGPVARATHTEGALGAHLDALADLVAFGVAPAMLAWAGPLRELGSVGTLIASVYLGATALRLARHQAIPPTSGTHTEGLSSTMSGGTIAAWGAAGVQVTAPVAAGVVLLLAMLMLTNLPYRTLRGTGPLWARVSLGCTLLGTAIAAVLIGPGEALAGAATIYLVGGSLDGIVSLLSDRDEATAAPRP